MRGNNVKNRNLNRTNQKSLPPNIQNLSFALNIEQYPAQSAGISSSGYNKFVYCERKKAKLPEKTTPASDSDGKIKKPPLSERFLIFDV